MVLQFAPQLPNLSTPGILWDEVKWEICIRRVQPKQSVGIAWCCHLNTKTFQECFKTPRCIYALNQKGVQIVARKLYLKKWIMIRRYIDPTVGCLFFQLSKTQSKPNSSQKQQNSILCLKAVKIFRSVKSHPSFGIPLIPQNSKRR